jgi:PAS domain S-box-containing protein
MAGNESAPDAGAFMASILDSVVQPVWVADRAGLIRFANPSALAAFGYADVSDLLGRPAHQTVHYKRPDGSAFPVEECTMLLPGTTGRTTRAEDWLVRRDGSLFPVEYWAAPIDMPGGRGAVLAFTDVTERRRTEAALHEMTARLVTAFDAARQRVTRDLHDGAQQRFVAAIIRLQMAQQKWAAEPRRAQELVDLALSDARRGLDELREIAAGIHPAILTQRGLATALSALTGRLPVPVRLDLPNGRLPDQIESSVYFFCSESLTNVVKHARASAASVRVAVEDDRCVIEVRDDGIGGAEVRPGASGLAGLRDRVGALNGAMDISSPAAGGTVLRAWIPLPPGPAEQG